MSDNGRRLEVWPISPTDRARLSIREAAVWDLALQGLSLREMGERLNQTMQALGGVAKRARHKLRLHCGPAWPEAQVSPGERCPACSLLLPCGDDCPGKIGAVGYMTNGRSNLGDQFSRCGGKETTYVRKQPKGA